MSMQRICCCGCKTIHDGTIPTSQPYATGVLRIVDYASWASGYNPDHIFRGNPEWDGTFTNDYSHQVWIPPYYKAINGYNYSFCQLRWDNPNNQYGGVYGGCPNFKPMIGQSETIGCWEIWFQQQGNPTANYALVYVKFEGDTPAGKYCLCNNNAGGVAPKSLTLEMSI